MARADLLGRVARSVWQEIEQPRRLVLRLECLHDYVLLDPEKAAPQARYVMTGLRMDPPRLYTVSCGYCAAIPHSRTNPAALEAIQDARRERAAERHQARRHIIATDEGFGYED